MWVPTSIKGVKAHAHTTNVIKAQKKVSKDNTHDCLIGKCTLMESIIETITIEN